MSDIILSPEHGINPSVALCFFCMKEMGIALLGRLPNDAEAPRQGVWTTAPCEKCEKCMSLGVILISVKDESIEQMNREQENFTRHHAHNRKKLYIPNPYRTGGWCVVKDNVIKRMVTSPELADQIIRVRFCFVPDTVWDNVQLPRGPLDGVPQDVDETPQQGKHSDGIQASDVPKSSENAV